MLSALFGISKSSVENGITEITPILFANLKTNIKWLSLREWRDYRGNWEKIVDAVALLLDGTSYGIYRPISEPQEQF